MNAASLLSRGFAFLADAPPWLVLLAKITAILLAAWAVHWALRRANPRWRVFLWRVTAVGLIALPTAARFFPALEIRVEQPATANDRAENAVSSKDLLVDPHLTRPDQAGLPSHPPDKPAPRLLPARPHDSSDETGRGPLPQPQGHAPALVKPSLLTWPTMLLAVWLGGIGLLVCRLCTGHYRVWRMARRVEQPPQWVRSECTRVAQAIGCRGRVEVVQSAAVQSPLLCGVRRPLLVLPVAMCEDSYRQDLPAIFAHELTHVRSHDVRWNAGLHLVSIALWFHPLAWQMRRAHLAACELVSDAVSAGFVGDVTEYCRTLARVAVHAYASVPAAGIAMARVSSISRRLGALREKVFHLPLRRRSVIGFGFVALAAMAVLGVLHVALAAPPPAQRVAAAEKAEAKPVEKGAKPAEEQAKADLPQPAESAAATTKTGLLRVLVLDPQGQPLPGAKVHASIWTDEKDFKANRDYETDAAGSARVELPKSFTILRLWASKRPLVTMFAGWEQNELASGKGLPEQYTFRLESSVTAGGRIVDEQGQPIVGAKVQVMLRGDAKPAQGDGRTGYNTWLALKSADPKVGENPAPTTDSDGRWRIDNVPDNPKAELSLLVSHPDYISDEYWQGIQRDAGVTTAMLRNETATLALKRGVIVRGRVTDPAGKPIKDALVVHGDDPYLANRPSEFPTDADGQFQLPALPPRETTLTVIAPGWAPQLHRVNLQAAMPPQDFRMEPGNPIQLRFVDAAGKPIPEVSVNITSWRGGKSLYNIKHPKIRDSKIPEKADKNGVWEWTWAPNDPVKLHCYSYPLKGFAPCELEIAGGAPPRTVTLKAEHRVTGRVTNAKTGEPIPLFTVIPIDVFRKDWLHAERGNAVVGKDGRLEFLADRTDIPLRLRVEATGYRNQDGPEFRVGDDTSRTQDFRLQPSPPLAGVVLDAAGQPVAKAEVLLATPTEEARFQADWGNHKLLADAAGRFALPDPGEPFAVVARADAGFALVEHPAGQHDAGTLRLQAWASVRGQFRDGGQPVRGATILLQPVRLRSLDRPQIDATLQTRTGADGRFEFPRVPPAPVSARIYLGPWKDEGFRSGPSVPLELQPGQQVELDLGGAGTVVTGKVTLTGNVPADLDCAFSLNYLVRRAPGITPPPAIANLGFDARGGWRDTWHKTPEGLAYLGTLRHWFVKLAPDGTFRISGVPAGEYDLAIEVYARPSGCLVDPLARKVVRVTVTAADAARRELALPEIPAAVVPVPAVGDTPALSFQRADGTGGSLTDCRGRHTVVHFWASWCGPCEQQLPALRRLHDQFAARGLAMLGLSLDDDPAAWQAALKRLDLPWPQGRLAAAGDAGASSVPAYWLLDPAGKIVAKVNDPDELVAPLNAAAKIGFMF